MKLIVLYLILIQPVCARPAPPPRFLILTLALTLGQAVKTQCRMIEHTDFSHVWFRAAERKSVVLLPIITQSGTYVLTVAGNTPDRNPNVTVT